MKNFYKEKTLKIILSILLLLCLFQMPYGYYQLVRFFATFVFLLLAYYAKVKKRQEEVIIYIVLAILFQPLWKIALGRMLWNVIDVIVALGLMGSCIVKKK